jgi:hypothetical protein
LKDVSLGTNGITISLNGSYKLLNKLKQKIKMHLRGPIGKYILGIKDISYIIKGVNLPKEKKIKNFDWFSNHIESYSINCPSKINAIIKATSCHHEVILNIYISFQKESLNLTIDPLEIFVLQHDLECTGCFIPIINTPCKVIDKNTIQIQNCIIKGDFPSIQKYDQGIAINQSLKTNWTHGGIFSTKLEIILKR